MSQTPIKIATAQSSISKDVAANGHEIRRLMRLAKSQGADLIHFAEGALSGYVKSQIFDWQEVDWQTLERELKLTMQEAGNLDIWVVVGSNHRLTEPHRPHNSLYIFSNEAKLHTRYDKQFCSNTEINDWYTPGQSLGLFEVKGWRFGCAICIEIQFPELFLAYAEKQIDCLLFSTYANDAMFATQAQGYAASHNVWFSFSNVQEHSAILPSRMIAPSGKVQELCQSKNSSFVLSTLDPEDARWKVALKYAKPWRKKAREGSIYRSLFVDDPRSENKLAF